MVITDDVHLLNAILRDPADDAPRLAYADWLDENAGTVAAKCPKCFDGFRRHSNQYHPLHVTGLCRTCGGDMAVSAPDGRSDLAAHIRWAVAWPQNSAVCLCGCRGREPVPCETCRLMGGGIADIPRRADGETHYVTNRGFVAEVRLSTAAFLAHAAALFAAHPVTAVRLVDREPERRESSGGRYGWLWHEDGLPESMYPHLRSCTIIQRIWDLIDRRKTVMAESPTAAGAHAMLSAACVAYGRKLAGLPALSPPPAPRP